MRDAGYKMKEFLDTQRIRNCSNTQFLDTQRIRNCSNVPEFLDAAHQKVKNSGYSTTSSHTGVFKRGVKQRSSLWGLLCGLGIDIKPTGR